MGNSGVVMGRVLERRLRRRASGESGEAIVEFAALTVLAAIIIGLVVATPTLATAQKWTAQATAKILDAKDPTSDSDLGGVVPTGHGGKAAVAAAMSQRCVPYWEGMPPSHPPVPPGHNYRPAPPGTSCAERHASWQQRPGYYEWWLDCSSLVMWAWKKAGISLPRTAGAQLNYLRRKGKVFKFTGTGNLKPGDLIFYYGDPPQHVTMYIGNGQLIEAPHPTAYVHTGPVYTNPWPTAVGRPG